jgi:phosphotransferase system enzyme I (PtsP)
MGLVIQRAQTLEELLESAVNLVATEMGTDACSIYLLDPEDRQLRLMATHGLERSALGQVALNLGEGITGRVVQELRSIAVEDASSFPGYRYFPETKEEQFHSYLGVPLGIRNRPVGALVVQTHEQRAYTLEETQTLGSIAAQLAGVVENARLIDALSRGQRSKKYFEDLHNWHSRGRSRRLVDADDIVLQGGPVSPGIAIGPVLKRGLDELTPSQRELPFRGEEEERTRLKEAMQKTRREILVIQEAAEREVDEEHALVFSSHLLLLNDPVLMERMEKGVGAKKPAELAAYDGLEFFAHQLDGVADPYIRERREDIWDLRSRLLGHLQSQSPDDRSAAGKIVLTRNIAASLVVEVKAQGAIGILAERGGPTSHGALLARSMGIPAVTGIDNLVDLVEQNQCVVLDGQSGKVICKPSSETLKQYEQQAQEYASRCELALPFCPLPARTQDGVRIILQANIAVSADLAVARDSGAEGVGLYRTEFPFMIREDFPTRDEQARIYSRAFEHYPDGPICFRLLDLGGDKVLPGNALNVDVNPFQGYRSARVLLNDPSIVLDQVQAFLLAAEGRPISVLIPMVSSLAELRGVLACIHDAVEKLRATAPQAAKTPRIGVMIEVPAAVELAGALARQVDFLSIGSNDLIQYTLAANRENASASAQASPYHPAVLRMIRRTILAGHQEAIAVSLCGELAGQPNLTLALVAMGIDSLSLSPSSIPQLKRLLASAVVKPLVEQIDTILELSEPEEIQRALAGYLPEL